MYPSGRSRERGFHGILRAMAHNRSVYFLSCVGNMTIFSKLSMRATRILMDALSINSFLLHLRSVVAAMVVDGDSGGAAGMCFGVGWSSAGVWAIAVVVWLGRLCACVRLHVHLHVCMCTSAFARVRVFVHVCAGACVCMSVCGRVRVCTRALALFSSARWE